MQQNTTPGLWRGPVRHVVAGAILCLVAGCAVTPKSVALNEDRSAVAAGECDQAAEDCESTLSERYHYYLGLLSVYLMGL